MEVFRRPSDVVAVATASDVDNDNDEHEATVVITEAITKVRPHLCRRESSPFWDNLSMSDIVTDRRSRFKTVPGRSGLYDDHNLIERYDG